MYSQREGYVPKKDCNGCGAGWSAKLIPNTIYGLNIRPVCCRHDDRYECLEKSIEHKGMSDREFLNNLVRAIEADTKWWRNNFIMKSLMRKRAKKYYKAVKYFGGSAYWDGSNE